MSLFLVTSSDERTWPAGENILFSDYWCLKVERKKSWQNLNFEVFKNIKSEIDILIDSNKEVRYLENKLFGKLVAVLNLYHKVNHDENFWKILIGHWFRVYLSTTLWRIHTLEDILRTKPINGATFINLPETDFIPKDFDEMCKLSDNPLFGSCLDLKILKLMKTYDFPIKIIEDHLRENSGILEQRRKFFGIKPKKFLINLSWKFSHLFARKTDSYISSTYLPRIQEALFQLTFLQTPKNWRLYLKHKVRAAPDLHLRDNLSRQIQDTSHYGVIAELIFKSIPICYLEGFKDLQLDLSNSKLPKNPKFIFTSNDFASFDLFKIYAAKNSELGIKYFVGQHGNNYGTNIIISPTIEELTSHKFISWGENDKIGNKLSGFVLKNASRRSIKKSRGGILLVQRPLYSTKIDFTLCGPSLYLEVQKKFIELLDKKLSKKLTVRLYKGTANSIQSEIIKYREFNSDLKLEYGTQKISKLIDRNRLIIFSYDSTGLLENLALNVPTLAFWQFEMQHLTEDAKGYYQLLVDAGIVHFNPESIANKVNEIWSDVETWWQSPVVQIAREKFCFQYAKPSKKPIRDLRRIIRENLTN